MKNSFKLLCLSLILIGITGCISTADKVTLPEIGDVQTQLKIGGPVEELVRIVGTTPIFLKNGIVRFKMADGDIWLRCITEDGKFTQVLFWGTVVRLPDGTTIKKSSNDAHQKETEGNPICIDISIVTDFNAGKRTGKCYYEQYSPENILIEASEKGDKLKEVSLVFINGKYVLQKGDIPKGSEFKYLAGYLANLQLVQSLISKGIKEATPLENGRRLFSFKSNTEPFVIRILNKKIVYPAPWSVNGYVEPRKDKNGFDFDIKFKVAWKIKSTSEIQDTDFSGTFREKKKSFGENIIMSEWKQLYISTPGTLTPVTNPQMIFDNLL